MERRVDRLARILEELGGRARIAQLLETLRAEEGTDAAGHSAISIALNAENQRLVELGELPRFRTAKSGEQWGWVSFESAGAEGGSVAAEIEARIIEANRQVDSAIRERLQAMDWRTFESAFLTTVLEKLGFQDVEITQATRDGGADARVAYRRGIVSAKAIVSAKRWTTRSTVGVDEVRTLRGIRGDEDTAIIVTTGRFTTDAMREAAPSQNQRVVFLIDGEQLVEICKRNQIGVKRVEVSHLLVLDEEQLGAEAHDDEEEPNLQSSDDSVNDDEHPKRLRDNMLREIDVDALAELLDLSPNTVRAYRSVPDRVRSMGDKLRGDPGLRDRALELVAEARRG
jgi:restriction endonuclease Mrr